MWRSHSHAHTVGANCTESSDCTPHYALAIFASAIAACHFLAIYVASKQDVCSAITSAPACSSVVFVDGKCMF